MADRLTYWRCGDCCGTGRTILYPFREAPECRRCGGTGNALVDGERLAHEEALRAIDETRLTKSTDTGAT